MNSEHPLRLFQDSKVRNFTIEIETVPVSKLKLSRVVSQASVVTLPSLGTNP